MPHVPARYLGYPVVLKEGQGRLYDGDGKPLASNLLVAGMTLLIPDTELYGMTYKRSTRQGDDRTYLGPGRIIAPEDEQRSDEELAMLGYEFHEGRSDFEPYTPADGNQPAVSQARRRVRGAPIVEDALPVTAVFTPEETPAQGENEGSV